MSVRIHFDRPHSHFTNLDFLTGKVIFNLAGDAAISAITVKLEGESRTRLSGPRPHYDSTRPDKSRTELEWHKLLYKVEKLFPPPEIQASGINPVLAAGQYEYPFRFKFPFNNACQKNALSQNLGVSAIAIGLQPDLNVKHVKRTLPPSLSGFPGEAEIKYYVKATVVRPKFYQENIRSQVDIKFLPIEPPRPKERFQETFARRNQQFASGQPAEPTKKGLFRKSSTPTGPTEPPVFSVEARLPSPAIITCNEPLPLRILVEKISDSNATVFLSMLQIELIGYTHVRAHDLSRTESGSWVIVTLANMKIPLGDPSDPVNKEWKVDSSFWDSIALPNTVAPSFDTCNISRNYELEVRIGLSQGGKAQPAQSELLLLPLRLPVKIYSGIAPPPELLHRLGPTHAQGLEGIANQAANAPSVSPGANSKLHPSTPTQAQSPGPRPPGAPSPYSPSGRPPNLDDDDDTAPPSYEDAMADEIAPVDGPRREYNIPTAPPRTESGFGTDSKSGGGIGRRVSERLFPGTGRGHSRNDGEADGFDENAPPARDGTMTAGAGQLGRRPTLPPSFEESTAGRDR